MNQLHPLSDFFKAISEDPRISITHIGIYAALLAVWNEQHLQNPMYVFSHNVMPLAKISSVITYHKCVRELSEYGYIRYEPSFNKKKGSKIYFRDTSVSEGK